MPNPSLPPDPLYTSSLAARVTIDTPVFDPTAIANGSREEPLQLLCALRSDLPDCEVVWYWRSGYIAVTKTFVLLSGAAPDLKDFFDRVKASSESHLLRANETSDERRGNETGEATPPNPTREIVLGSRPGCRTEW